jgi:hypothetical protein
MTEYKPLNVCPIRHKSSQEEAIPSTTFCPEHSNLPSVCTPDEYSKIVLPKFKRVIGKTLLSVIIPAEYLKNRLERQTQYENESAEKQYHNSNTIYRCRQMVLADWNRSCTA